MRWAIRVAPLLAMVAPRLGLASEVLPRYYAYPAVEDRHGVIAPWYRGQNGQCDFRVRIAAETLKRYPWTGPGQAPSPAPHYVYNGSWSIAPDGTITIPPLDDWSNGDLGQRAAYVLTGLVDYYRYTGDPAAISHLTVTADALLDHCLTPAGHPWPGFLVSVPNRGKPYGKCDPRGFIQLDIVAEVGLGLVRAYELTGNKRWLRAAAQWAELLAEKRDRSAGVPPWGRYANPQDVGWEDLQTGGVVFIVAFLDEVIRVGYRGKGDSIVQARDDGRAYLREVLLPRWAVNDTWGRNYWDWPDPVQAENVTEFAARYLLENPRAFPNWRTDARNLLTLFLNHTCVSTSSRGDVYSGAWAYPESSGCCGRSLWYGPLELAPVYAEYGVLAGSEWAREMARRQMILATYDCRETGVVEDNIDGGPIVAGAWFKIAHPMALKHALNAMAWLPDVFGANRENHLMRTASVVRHVAYGDGRIAYSTFDAPRGGVDVLRLAFAPSGVCADGRPVERVSELSRNGYAVRRLRGGDCLVSIRHDGRRNVVVEGDDPQQSVDARGLATAGDWVGGRSSAAGAEATFQFTGNQVRLIGAVEPEGGLADVYLDGVKQLVGVDCWCPERRSGQVLYYRNGLANGTHTLRLVVRGAENPLSEGQEVCVEGVQWSEATGDGGFGSGGGPTEAQRVVCGYAGRADIVDSAGHAWRPATEFVARTGDLTDSVALTWWTERRRMAIENTPDPELYRYGVHGRDFAFHFTVGPGTYHARLKLAETRNVEPRLRAASIRINDTEVVSGLDIAATAGGMNRAVDLVYNGLRPAHGVIAIRFLGSHGGEAIVQAIEVGPGDGGQGATPVVVAEPPERAGNLLANPGFEEGVAGALGELGATNSNFGWRYVFASATRGYVWGEAYCGREHPDWGTGAVHSGDEALRTHTDHGAHTIVYQEVEAKPETRYRASVWMRAADVYGRGFGTQPGDSAGLIIQELGEDGSLLLDHPKVGVTRACEFSELTRTFTTTAKTARLRFILDTTIGAPYNEGHVTYDDCALVRE